MSSLNDVYHKLETDILPQLLPCITQNQAYNPKVIHDHLWGSSSFYPWEIALLDTPLLQRLRQIHQLGTASFTYPSAVHNRFSHTLGVCVLAGQLITNLRDKVTDTSIICHDESMRSTIITQKDVYTIRLAALLHDIGHCFFSHCTESLAKNELHNARKEIATLHKNTYSTGTPPKEHELISYLIITSKYFATYWNKNIKKMFGVLQDVPEPEEIAKLIVGAFISKEKKYLTEILNGPYDVDKLEYLHRDAKSAGLAITYDRERFFQKISLFYDDEERTWQLVMGVSGIQAVEQMMLNKMMLAPYVYHHQKVLVADSMIYDICELILQQDEKTCSIQAKSYFDFLLYTDADLLANSFFSKNEQLNYLSEALRNRRLPKRCFVLHKDFIREQGGFEPSEFFTKIRKRIFENAKECRKRVHSILKEQHNNTCSISDIYISNTTLTAKFDKISESAMVITKDGQIDQLKNHWVMGNWDETYSARKEFIFFHISNESIENGFNAVLSFLNEEFDAYLGESRSSNAEDCYIDTEKVKHSVKIH